ncbi:MAG TPA: hypothetical protein VF556_02225 [Pyrinomonadaceae bacterium]
MAKESNGYIGKYKNGKWFARITFIDNNGKRKNIVKSAAHKA